MRIFLKLKHWQLFLIWICTGIVASATIFSSSWILTFAIYDFVLIGWIYSIGKLANKINRENKIENYNEDLWFVLLLLALLTFGYFTHTVKPENGFIMFGASIFEAISAIKLVNFSAKAIVQYDKKKALKFSDYASEFLLILFLPIGVWRIQPKMNELIEKN